MSRIGMFLGQRVSVAVLVFASLMVGEPAEAADHRVSANTRTVKCASFNGGVEPGDTLTLAGGNRSNITFQNCKGTRNAPIVIRNDSSASSRTTIAGSSTYAFHCIDCEWLTIDGTQKWSGAASGMCGSPNGRNQCGIKIRCSSGDTDSWLRISGSSKNVTVQGVEIDGGFPNCDARPPGVGIGINDHTYKRADHPGEWREGFVIRHNYVHDTASECIYFGPNQNDNASGDLLLRNNEIGFNLVENCGYDGIEVKSTVQGSSEIHHNIIRNTGIGPGDNTNGNNGHGISLFESGYTDVHHNWVEGTSAAGTGGACYSQFIQNLSSSTVQNVPTKFFNNVAARCHGNGITIGRKQTNGARPEPTIIHNTVISAGSVGINTNTNVTQNGRIMDNIACGSGAGDISASGQIVSSNNRTGGCSSNRFRNLGSLDVRLTSSSPAIDKGRGGDAPNDDYDGVPRPQGSAPDQGAFEYAVGVAASGGGGVGGGSTALLKPKPPSGISIQ